MTESNHYLDRISFGCSNLLGDKTAEQGGRLLDAAYEAGIRNFDVARVYNFGDAERLLGKFAAGRRDQIAITTKFGLMPNANIAKMGPVIAAVRRLMRASGFIRKIVRRNVSKMTQSGRFDVSTARTSLEESLKALHTDFLDILLMHEAAAVDCTEELFAFLDSARQQGKIRMFGVGSGFGEMPQIAASAPRFLEVAQFPSSPVHDNRSQFEPLRPSGNKLIVTHGSFEGTGPVRQAVSTGAPEVKEWSRRVGFDLAAPGMLFGALLQAALRSNPGGRVIFRASTEQRIAENMRALGEPFADVQLDALEALCREEALARSPSA